MPWVETRSRIMAWWEADLACGKFYVRQEKKFLCDESCFFTQLPAYTEASPALGTSSAWVPELPPVLGPATSAEGSCDFGVTRTSFPKCILSSLVP
jgi:hypothetical protein